MIRAHCFTEDWLTTFKKQKEHRRIDKAILEKMIYALHLLERIKANGLDFVFKGGTSLILLLEENHRFSIDIDIICNESRGELERVLTNVVNSSKFTSVELDVNRSYQQEVPKAHYVFSFNSVYSGKYSGNILLDVLIEDSIYPKTTEKLVQTKWIQTNQDTFIVVPSIDAIVGDKLTAFAPNTVGIPYFKGKDKQSFAMEICKQLFDLGKLFEKIEQMEIVAQSFDAFAQKEITYRGLDGMAPETVLQDTIDTCIIIAKRGAGSEDEKSKFMELQRGIRAFGTGFLMVGNFRIDDAILAASRIAYLSAKLLHKELSPIECYDGQALSNLIVVNTEFRFLNKLKRQPDKSGFYYWFKYLELTSQVN